MGEAAGSKPMCERRAWGEYRVIDASERPDGTRSVTNEVVLTPGGQVTYRRHQLRHEVWTFMAGEGEIVVEGEMRRVRAGDSVSVAPRPSCV